MSRDLSDANLFVMTAVGGNGEVRLGREHVEHRWVAPDALPEISLLEPRGGSCARLRLWRPGD